MLSSLKANILVWEMLLHQMAKLGRVIKWEHVPTHINVQGGGELRVPTQSIWCTVRMQHIAETHAAC